MQVTIPDSLRVTLGQQQIPDCLKSVLYFGSTTYMDVCSGTSHVVPWGGVDWLLFVVLSALGLAFAAFLVGAALSIRNF